MSFSVAVLITVLEGSFMIEERKTGTSSKLMTRLIMRTGGLTRYMPAVPVSLPYSFQRALPKLENRDASDLKANGFNNCLRVCSFMVFRPTMIKELRRLQPCLHGAFSLVERESRACIA